ncbi:MAG: transposase family protein [Nitrospira sp.]
MNRWLSGLLARWKRFLRWVQQNLITRVRYRSRGRHGPRPTPRPVFAQPKPTWVRDEVLRLKALMPEAGCRTIAHHFNRRWKSRRQMTVSKTYVADTCRRHQHLIYEARRKMKHRIPRPIPRNRVWGCDLLMKTDQGGHSHLALALVDHASRACLRLQHFADKSSLTRLHELAESVKRYGQPQFLRTDNEAVFVSRWFRLGLWLLRIRHQRIEPGCPW